jgi:hypothetical protein
LVHGLLHHKQKQLAEQKGSSPPLRYPARHFVLHSGEHRQVASPAP